MQWVAPSEKDAAIGTLEKRLWDSADPFRANSGLKAREYSGPILGIIFLRFAEVHIARQRAKLESPSPLGTGERRVGGPGLQPVGPVPSPGVPRRGSRVDDPATCHAEVIEPYHGRILDPACGSGGMFVSSAQFVAEHKKNPSAELSIHGVEKTDETGRLCRLNLAVHGLEGDIRDGGQVNSYYDDPHDTTGRFEFVLANPPFNVNAVDKERLKDMVGSNRRFAFGLPRTHNANCLWIQLFHSALKASAGQATGGRVGFVMANSASDARASEQEIRQKLIESRAVSTL